MGKASSKPVSKLTRLSTLSLQLPNDLPHCGLCAHVLATASPFSLVSWKALAASPVDLTTKL